MSYTDIHRYHRNRRARPTCTSSHSVSWEYECRPRWNCSFSTRRTRFRIPWSRINWRSPGVKSLCKVSDFTICDALVPVASQDVRSTRWDLELEHTCDEMWVIYRRRSHDEVTQGEIWAFRSRALVSRESRMTWTKYHFYPIFVPPSDDRSNNLYWFCHHLRVWMISPTTRLNTQRNCPEIHCAALHTGITVTSTRGGDLTFRLSMIFLNKFIQKFCETAETDQSLCIPMRIMYNRQQPSVAGERQLTAHSSVCIGATSRASS